MGALLEGRRRMIRTHGRPMRLVRQRAGQPDRVVDLVGYPHGFAPDQLGNNLTPADQQVEILEDEVAAAGFPLPMTNPDRMLIDGRTSTVQSALPIFEGAERIGWRIWVRG